MTAEQWTHAVRQRLALGRLLPLGGPRDGAWISEEAAGAVLRRAAREVPGVRVDALRIGPADPEDVSEPVVPPPPGALPPGPLRVTAEFAATAAGPLPATAARLRAALAAAATRLLGPAVTQVDLRVTALLDAEPERPPVASPRVPEAARPGTPDEERVTAAVLAVAGVARLTAGLGCAMHVEERRTRAAGLPHRHVRVEVAVEAGQPAVEVARRVRRAVAGTLPGRPTVAVLVTAVG
ncbi:nucleopolyhedrovirus P10 family protein [Streptomyces sp. NPDC000987]|uniref:nucleopolyhedrovirus P10 family protein n=1 Tax=Streptomyces sp. NPDC000987 TaxID=3154374 RepID=UPI003321F5F7